MERRKFGPFFPEKLPSLRAINIFKKIIKESVLSFFFTTSALRDLEIESMIFLVVLLTISEVVLNFVDYVLLG